MRDYIHFCEISTIEWNWSFIHLWRTSSISGGRQQICQQNINVCQIWETLQVTEYQTAVTRPFSCQFHKKRFSITKTECMTSKLQNSNHITNTCDTIWLMIAFACENLQNWHHDKFMGPLLNFRTCKLKNELTVFSLAYIQPKNTVYRTSHPIYCLRKLILDRWGPYDENFDLVCSSFLTLFTKQRLPFWFSCKHESVADHMTWLIYHQPMKISHTKLFCSVFVRIELIGTQTLLQPENVSQIWQTFMFCCQICCRPPKMEDILHKWIKLHGFVQLWKTPHKSECSLSYLTDCKPMQPIMEAIIHK